MKNKSISIMHTKRFQSIFNRYSIFFSILTLLPSFLLFSIPVIAIFRVFWIFILLIFLLITFFIPLLSEDFKNTFINATKEGTTTEVIRDVLISTYYLPLILVILSAFCTFASIVATICNRKYNNSKGGLIGAIIMLIIASLFCIFYYAFFDSFIGGTN